LLLVGYPGYGGGEGSPSESALVAAARQNYSYLQQQGLAAQDIVILGQSLGTAVAVQLAAESPSAAVVLLAPMLSVQEIAQSQYPMFPISLLLKDPFRSDRYIGNISAPLLVVHGTSDGVIPIESGRQLFALANGTKVFESVNGAGHNNLYEFDVIDIVADFLRSPLEYSVSD